MRKIYDICLSLIIKVTKFIEIFLFLAKHWVQMREKKQRGCNSGWCHEVFVQFFFTHELFCDTLPLCGQKRHCNKAALEDRNLKTAEAITFCLECKVAELADIRPDVGVRSDVLLQHARLLAADAALLADVLSSPTTTNVYIVLIGFIPGRR